MTVSAKWLLPRSASSFAAAIASTPKLPTVIERNVSVTVRDAPPDKLPISHAALESALVQLPALAVAFRI